jgi:hypothetical protein
VPYVLLAAPVLRVDYTASEPTPKIRVELETASAAMAGSSDFDHLIAPYLAFAGSIPIVCQCTRAIKTQFSSTELMGT